MYIHVRSGKVLVNGKVKTMTTTTTAGATGATEAAGATTITKSPSSDGTINVDTLSTAAASNVEATFLFVIMTSIGAVILACSCCVLFFIITKKRKEQATKSTTENATKILPLSEDAMPISKGSPDVAAPVVAAAAVAGGPINQSSHRIKNID